MCPARFRLNEAFFCGWGLPRRKPRKNKSLKECEICLAKNKQKPQKVANQKAGLDVPKNVVGKGLAKKTETIRAYAQSLAEGKYKRYSRHSWL
jgi:ribosome-binding protein aMBF1 (putative translation factor)